MKIKIFEISFLRSTSFFRVFSKVAVLGSSRFLEIGVIGEVDRSKLGLRAFEAWISRGQRG